MAEQEMYAKEKLRKLVNDLSAGKELSQEAIEARREYYRKWYAKNKEKAQENRRKYWERKAERMEAERAGNGEQKDG